MKQLLRKYAVASARYLKSRPAFARFRETLGYDSVNRNMFANLREHDRMLADPARLEPYYAAIRKHVREGDRVIDLGTGSGILSLIAASAKPRRIYAIDHSDIIEVAQAAARHNGVDCIQFERINSRRFRLDEPVDVIIHEQIGDYLFEENMVENVTDLRDRLLKPGGRILPNRFELYVEPVMLKPDYRIPFTWENTDLFGLDFSFVKALMREKLRDDYFYRSVANFEVDRMLCAPEPVLKFDLETVQPGTLATRVAYRREVLKDGQLDGIALYFRAAFDDDIAFDNAPLSPRTSWVGRLLRVEARPLAAGDHVELALDLSDLANPNNWRWTLT